MNAGRIAAVVFVCGAVAGAAPGRHDALYTIAYASFGPLNTAVFVANADGTGERILLPNPVLDSNPSFSPDGRWVLFTSRRDGSDDIYRIHTDGSNLERLTADPAFDDQAAMSPDGRHIAFVSSRSGQADIWLLDVPTRRLRNLTDHPGGDYRPSWSPDGRWIAFTSDRDSAGARESTGAQFAPRQVTQIYIMGADGSDLRRLTNGEDAVGGASWSPDGTAIVCYEAATEDWQVLSRTFPGVVVRSQITTIDVATGARAALTTGPGRKLTPQWIGRGRIAYVRADTEEQPGQQKRSHAYWSEGIRFTDGTAGPVGVFTSVHWSADGTRMVYHRAVDDTFPPFVKTFSRDPDFHVVRTGFFPSYSPDGRRLASTTPASGLVRTWLYVAQADGSNARVLFDDPTQSALAPAWAPKGDRIAFGLGTFFPFGRRYAPAQIAVINGDGSGLRRLTPDDGGNYEFPSWSPDAKRLVLRAATPASKGLSILDVASGTLTPLTPDSGTDNLPAWSPKGDVITFTSRREGDWEIYAIRPDGTGLKRLTHSPGNEAHASWSPDARWIAFSSARGGFKDEMARGGGGGQGATDIFVMRPDGTDVRRLTDDATEEGTTAFAWKK
jgi:Tol biopolymer transport system component